MEATRESTRKAARTPRLARPQRSGACDPAGEGSSPPQGRLVPSAEASMHDSLSSSLSQLAAMLNTASAGFESFDAQTPKIKENFIWACATLAADCERMIDRLDAMPLRRVA